MKPETWIVNGEVGTSSKTIWAVMMGAVLSNPKNSHNYGVPHDPDDFSRCWKLLVLFPEWRARLHKVANQFPAWVGFVREWDKLTEMYEALLDNDKNFSREMYDFMRTLEDEGRLADGWVRDSSSAWHKGEPTIWFAETVEAKQ